MIAAWLPAQQQVAQQLAQQNEQRTQQSRQQGCYVIRADSSCSDGTTSFSETTQHSMCMHADACHHLAVCKRSCQSLNLKNLQTRCADLSCGVKTLTTQPQRHPLHTSVPVMT
jgi:hypothetical protein